jgi:hypothetical protein
MVGMERNGIILMSDILTNKAKREDLSTILQAGEKLGDLVSPGNPYGGMVSNPLETVNAAMRIDAAGGTDAAEVQRAKDISTTVHGTLGGYDLKGKATSGLIGPDGQLGKLTDKIKPLAKAGKDTVIGSIKSTPQLAKTKETIESIEKVGAKVKDTMKPLTNKLGAVKKGANKVLGSKLAKGVGQAAQVVTGGLTALEGTRELLGSKGDEADKVGSGMKIAGGIGGAAAGAAALTAGITGVAAANFWNPIGWVAGALAIGGTLVQMRDKFR